MARKTVAYKKRQSEMLAKFIAWQFIGFFLFELLVAALIAVGLIPAYLTIRSLQGLDVIINTGFLVMVSLIITLTATGWLAFLVEVLDIVEMKNIE